MVVALRGIIPLLFFVLWAYCVLDSIATDSSRVQNLPKLAWVFIVILFPPVGPIAWLLLGRPSGAGIGLGAKRPRRERSPGRGYMFRSPERGAQPQLPQQPPLSQEDREEALRRYYEDKRRREQEQRGLGDESSGPDPSED